MIIKSLSIQNFRNHESTKVDLCDGLNVFVGQNAQGKTNLLEAIYMTCVGRGFRSARDRDVIMFGKDFARVKTIAQKKYGKVDVEIIIAQGKQIKINGIPINKMGELMGTMTCVFFNPDELKLIKEAPADRRRFMDIDISQIDKTYFYNLLKYNKILKQRNALLKSMSPKPTQDELRSLDIWDDELAKVAEPITIRRQLFCEELAKEIVEVHKHLAPNEIISLSLEISAPLSRNCSMDGLDRTYEMFHVEHSMQWNNFQSVRDKDLRLRTTTVGPHRDDIAISINGKDVRGFASQGQQRTVALSMKLAELKIFERVTGERPILLLDDVFSELDEMRRTRLLSLLKGWQTIITTTEFDKNFVPLNEIVPRGTIYILEKGKVRC